jgi:KUP system potassium uptake protein
MGDSRHHQSHINKISAAGLLVTLGIIYGDIGTSPLYVMNAIFKDEPTITRAVVLGAISCVFWTLTLQTTIKYVIITLRADNKGEGGIFSLYALVRRRIPWLMWPAIIGGSALLADGIITPPISVSSAIEGLQIRYPEIQTIPIVIGILTALFIIQQFGTGFVGKAFGPIMFLWFSMLGVLGIMQLNGHWDILNAVNPAYAYNLLVNHPEGFWLLGAVFLCTTGAEALYSDLGHCGRDNIRVSWVFVKITLLLNYFGQGAWLLQHQGEALGDRRTFYELVPPEFLIVGIIIATIAAVIASQALISGSFTLISEAIRLNFWPKLRIMYPTDFKGQLYIPAINTMLWAGCIAVTLYFQESSAMEAAYGLSITVTMLMTTVLLYHYLKYVRKVPFALVIPMLLVFVFIECSFLLANLLKFMHGGWVTLVIATSLIAIMYVWYRARKIKNRYTEFEKIDKYVPMLTALSADETVPKNSTHLVYLTSANFDNQLETKIIYSIFQKQPKRADVYWFIHVDVLDTPYTMEYKVIELVKEHVFRIDFRLGFRVEPKINLLFRQVVENMVGQGEVDITSRYESLKKEGLTGDFRFVVLEKYLSHDNNLSFLDKVVMDVYAELKKLSLSEERGFGLDTSSVTVEKVPMVVSRIQKAPLKRIERY